CNLSPAAIAELNGIKSTITYPRGALLFVEGEEPRAVFILCNGRAKLMTTSAEGRTLIVKIAGPGEILGASAAILGQPYELSAETLEPCQVNVINGSAFVNWLRTRSEASVRAARQLSAKHDAAQQEIRSLGLTRSAAEKLARLLLDWCRHGEFTAGGIRIRVLLTHEEIGQMIGATRETVTRLIGDLRRREIIETKGSTVIVRQKDALEKLVTL